MTTSLPSFARYFGAACLGSWMSAMVACLIDLVLRSGPGTELGLICSSCWPDAENDP